MEEKDLISVAIQLPIVALFFWLVGREINKLAERVDAQSKLFQDLVRDTNAVIRESTSVNASLKTFIETTVARCALYKETAEERHERQERRAS